MKKILAGAVSTALLSTAATAGGVERTAQSIAPLFEDGNYFELSFGSVSPSVSGSAIGANSGGMASDYTQVGFAYKHQFTDTFSLALIYDQPFGADVSYPTGTGYVFQGSTAELNSNALTAIGRYKFDNNFSVHGGLRYQTLGAVVTIPAIASYSGSTNTDEALGYLVGIAYEKPEIALRVALTYNSKIKHSFSATEASTATGGANIATSFASTTPQSLNLDFQTGIAQNTLLFGGIRWVEWSAFDISPTHYGAITGGRSLVSYADDVFTYTLGIGRKLNESWSVSASLSHEKSNGGFASNLGPTDGKTGVTLGARYTRDNMTISGGINYTWIGDASTIVAPGPITSSFTDNSAVGLGFKVGYSF